ncbi:MAG: hypothetical protein JG776_1302 [Caloramator sp.]|jgi:hypothetical protein|uniref:hypothetical protein n=1 Tax=Caloramator sp. TaxID=1871330 RepID=UPI001E03B38E|nr:hypothetical protein [Caloramator sp.]MBZ4663587.1 hypothetical protein [Caloramator sp.]
MFNSIYLYIGDILYLIEDKSPIYFVLKKMIEDGVLLDKVNNIVPYDILLTQEEYLNRLISYIEKDIANKGALIKKIVETWINNYGLTFEEYFSDGFNEEKINKYIREQSKDFLWFGCILSGNYRYLADFLSRSNYIYIEDKSENKDKKDEDIKEELKKIKYENERLKNELIERKKTNDTLLNKLNDITLKLKRLEEENKKIYDENNYLKAKLLLINKKIALIIDDKNITGKIEKIKEEYYLKEIKLYSSNQLSPNIDDINSDFIIFCSERAQHDVYKKIKSKSNNIFHIKHNNINIIFDNFIKFLGRNIKND